MRLGRDFTNLLYFEYLSQDDRKRLEEGELAVSDMDAMAQIPAKSDILKQIITAKSLGLDHVELDGAVPNPYLNFNDERRKRVREAASSNGISLSLHLPYSYIGANLCAPEELDRRAAVELQMRYLKFASEIGCKYCVLHPGVAPFYQAVGKYLERMGESLVKSLLELARSASDLRIELHLENNTAFDLIFFEPAEICEVIERVKAEGANIYFCFDIGHWLTRLDAGRKVPDPPERILEEIPAGMFKELHLNDYIPGRQIFHPPLHEGLGVLKRENLERYAELVEGKGAELIVVETAIKTREQVMRRDDILREETKYLREIFG
jgi:sugar phosphate isomerase/epimerase